MAYRVAQWSVGGVGRQALRALVRSSDFDLVGVFTHSASRSGPRRRRSVRARHRHRGAGQLGRRSHLGTAARNRGVVFTSVGETRPKQAVDEVARILRSGANVVSSSMINLVYPPTADPRAVGVLTEACAHGGTTMFTSGLDPGFSGDALPLAALQICERVDTLRVQELSDYGTHPDGAWATPYGFGQPAGAPAPLLAPGVPTLFWGGMVGLVADVLHVELDRLEEFCERWYSPETFDVPIGRIEKDTLAAVRFGVAGVVNGERRLFAEHVTRMRPDMAPHWPCPPAGASSVHRVEIEGRPSVTLDLVVGSERGGSNGQGLLATAMRLVNAVPAVVAAAPGMVSALDLRFGPGRNLLAGGLPSGSE